MTALGLLVIGLVISAQKPVNLVVRTFPDDGGGVGTDNRVGVEFAEPMNAETVSNLFEIAPATAGKLNWDGQRLWFVPDQSFQPGVCYTGLLMAGAVSQRGQRLTSNLTWRFTLRQPAVLYLSLANGHRQLWRLPTTGGNATPLTSLSDTVYDFAPAPSGEQIAYSASNNRQGTDLWLMTRDGANKRLLVDCGPDQCETPAWSPDGRLIAYGRYPAGTYAEEAKYPDRIWTVDLNTRETTPLYQDPQVLGRNPSWSPDGRWLAFFDASIFRIRVLDFKTRQEVKLRTSGITVGAWSPDGNQMLVNDLNTDSGTTKALVYLAAISQQTTTVVLGKDADGTFYGPPAWSPNGEWVVVRVQHSGSGPGNQLWLMRPDGQDGRFITTDPAYDYTAYQWDTCGGSLLVQRVEVNKSGAKTAIGIWSMATGEMRVLTQDASTPDWLP